MEAGLNWSTMSPQEQDAFRQMFKQTQKVVKTRRRAMRAADDRALVAAAASDDPVVAAKARTALEKGRNAAVGAALALPGHSHTQAENFGVPGYRPKQP